MRSTEVEVIQKEVFLEGLVLLPAPAIAKGIPLLEPTNETTTPQQERIDSLAHLSIFKPCDIMRPWTGPLIIG